MVGVGGGHNILTTSRQKIPPRHLIATSNANEDAVARPSWPISQGRECRTPETAKLPAQAIDGLPRLHVQSASSARPGLNTEYTSRNSGDGREGYQATKYPELPRLMVIHLACQAPCRKLAPRTSITAPNAAIQSSDRHPAACSSRDLFLSLEGYLCCRGVSMPRCEGLRLNIKVGIGRYVLLDEKRIGFLICICFRLYLSTDTLETTPTQSQRRDKKGMNSFLLPSLSAPPFLTIPAPILKRPNHQANNGFPHQQSHLETLL